MLLECSRRCELVEHKELGFSETRSSQVLSACWKLDRLAGWPVSCAQGLELKEDDSHHSLGDSWFASAFLMHLCTYGSCWRQAQDMTLRPGTWLPLVHWMLPFEAEVTVRTVRRDAISASAQEARQKAGRYALGQGVGGGRTRERGPGNVNNADMLSRFVQYPRTLMGWP